MPPAEPAHGLREREEQLAALRSAVDSARSGHGGVVVVVGAAGMGKTSLLRAVRSSAPDLRTLAARPGELERHLPFGVVRQLLEPVLATGSADERAALLRGAAALAAPALEVGPEPAGDVADRELFGILHGLYWLVANLCREQPLLMLLDDAQWADRPSLAFAGLLARRCEDLPLVLVIGTRPLEPVTAPELSQLLADATVSRIPLGPLSEGAVAAMVGDGPAGAQHPDFVHACLTQTGGNPFLLTELLREVAAQGLAPTADTARRIGTLAPDGVSAAIQLRLARTTPAARAVAEALAVLGDGSPLVMVARLADLDEPTTEAVVPLLVTAGLVQHQGTGLGFVHPLMRTTVLAALDPQALEASHRRAAEVLSESGADAATVAAHLQQTHPRGDDRTVSVLRRAARNARASGAPQTAATHLERALAEPPAAVAEVLVELGQAEAAAGLPGAEAHLRRAVEVAGDAGDVQGRADAVLQLARTLKFRRGAVEAVHLLRAELAAMPAATRVDAEWELVALGFASTGARQLLGDEVRKLPPARTPDEQVAAAGFASFNSSASGGSREEALADARRALAVRPLPVDVVGLGGFGTLTAAVTCYWSDDPGGAESALTEMAAAARSAGSPVAASTALSVRALIAWRRGDLADAAEDAREAVDLAAGLAVVPPLVAAAYGVSGLVAAEQSLDAGELDRVYRRLGQARLDPDGAPFAELLHARGVLRAAAGNLEPAVDHLLAAGREFTAWGATNPAVKPWRGDAARVLRLLGRYDEARTLVETEVELARSFGAPRALAVALASRSAVSATAGAGPATSADRAEADLREAVRLLEADGVARLDLARARLELGGLLRRTGRVAEARDLLAAAREMAARCGAHRTAEAAREELVATGLRPRRVAVAGVDALTGAERRVARLAAHGRSNRAIAQELFVSEKTVETHLGRAYTKLGIRSRTALAAVLSGDPAAGSVGA